MYEVEVKVRADHDRVRERLDAVGAEQVTAQVQVDTYYDAPDRSFADTDEALRIRRERPLDAGDGDRAIDERPDRDEDREGATRGKDGEAADGRAVLTYKGPKVDEASKTREEVETPVDPDAMATVLDRIGYRAVATVRKERVVHALEEYHVALDSVEGLGEFVEVETEATAAGVEEAREGVRDLLRRLDLDPGEGIRVSYLELLLASDDRGEVGD